MRLILLLTPLALALPAQDASLVLRTSVGYRTQRASRPLTDDQKKEADRLEAAAQSANQAGNYGDAIRHLYHGLAVMNDVPWTPTVEAASAYQAKADHAIISPAGTVVVQLKPLFQPDAAAEPLTVSLVLRDAHGDNEKVILEPRKLDSTLTAKLPAGVTGNYFLETRLTSPTPAAAKSKAYFVKSTPVHIEDLSGDVARLRTKFSTVPKNAPAAATAEYALALYEHADRGEANPHHIDFSKEFTAAQTVADALAAGRDPFAGQHGDVHRAYRSTVDNTLQPYRIFIPDNYDGTAPAPLVVALHGMGGDENSMFDAYGAGAIKREAARTGLMVVCPKGRDSASMYQGTAETDVLDVLAQVRRDLKIDPARIYLMGHSMGGFGTWSIAMRHPDIWAALGPISGGANPAGVAAIKNIPEYVVHGDNDKTVNIMMSRVMVQAAKKAGANVTFVEVPGGSHTDVVVPQFAPMFDFLVKQKKSALEATATK